MRLGADRKIYVAGILAKVMIGVWVTPEIVAQIQESQSKLRPHAKAQK